MVLYLEFTAEQPGADQIARELAYSCVINPSKYFEKCNMLEGAERRRCKNRVSFGVYCVKRTDLVVEIPSNNNIIALAPCVLALVRRYGSDKAVKRKILELSSELGEPVKLSNEDIRAVIRWVENSPFYFILSEYANKVALSCHFSAEALRLIKVLDAECKAVSTLLLGYIIAMLNTMTLQKALRAADDLVYDFARTCSHIIHISRDFRGSGKGSCDNVVATISDILHELVNTLLEVYLLTNNLAKALKNEVYSKYVDTTPSRQRFGEYMAKKLLQYNAFMRICTELKQDVKTTDVEHT